MRHIISLTFIFLILFFVSMLIVGYFKVWGFDFVLSFLKDNHQIVQIIIAITGGLFVFLSLRLGYERYNQTQEQIELTKENELTRFKQTEDNNLNTTFKDAVTLLGHESTSVRMGGVHTLIDIAKANPDKYAERVNTILCQHITDRSNIEYEKFLEENNILKKDAIFIEDITQTQEVFTYILYSYNPNDLEKKLYLVHNCFDINNKILSKIENIAIDRIKNNSLFYFSELNFLLQKYFSSQEIKNILQLIFENNNIFNSIRLHNAKLGNLELNFSKKIYEIELTNCLIISNNFSFDMSKVILKNSFIKSSFICALCFFNNLSVISNSNLKSIEIFNISKSYLNGLVLYGNLENINITQSNISCSVLYSDQDILSIKDSIEKNDIVVVNIKDEKDRDVKYPALTIIKTEDEIKTFNAVRNVFYHCTYRKLKENTTPKEPTHEQTN